VRSRVRISLLALAACALVAVAAPAGAQAAFGVGKFFAANCKTAACEPGDVVSEAFATAGGHPPAGITDFTVNLEGEVPSGIATEGPVTHIRTDVAPGVSTNPQAVHQCSEAEFNGIELAEGVFSAPAAGCTAALIGENKAKIFPGAPPDIALAGNVYNVTPTKGLASLFAVALELGPLGFPGAYAHTFIKGHVEWASDYHDYFEIEVSPKLPLVSSRLIFKGNIGTGLAPIGSGGFLTNPTSCTGIGPQTTSTITLESQSGAKSVKQYEGPVGAENCAALPFAPGFALTPETTQSDQPDGISTELTLPHDLNPGAGHVDSSQVETVEATLPEGMTLNPSAAAGLQACTPAQARITSKEPGVACPAASKVGTATLNVPGLPAGALSGNVYLGAPESGTITEPPYTMYLDAESAQYGLSVRLKGLVKPNETTGRVTAVFAKNPEQPFSTLTLNVNGGALSPIANPLTCGTATAAAKFIPYSGTAAVSPVSSFTVDSNNAGGACASPLPFTWTQSATSAPPKAGASPAFTFNLARPDGQQYLEKTRVVLPPGLVGKIPAVAQCAEAQANAGTCPAASKIGVVTALAGSGTPYPFTGNVFLTGPYQGAPYGLSIVVPVVAGPYNLGTEVTRSKIEVDPNTARVIVSTPKLPTIRGGIPVRLRSLTVTVNTPNYILNPTNCSLFQTESTLTSTLGALQNVSSGFQVEGCSSLAFKPAFKSTTTGKTSKTNGASLETTVNQPAGQANMKSIVVQLPKQLPSRLTTLQKACPAATFNANPYGCPAGSYVGGARANTPVLPGKMTGPAVLVSHGGAAFPDLDLVLEANGVRVIVVGNTDIKKGITTTTFATTPDVPVTSVTVNLPTGPHSALAANGNLCTSSLVMPTTITGQNGKVVKQNTNVAVSNCGVQVVGQKVIGNSAYLTVRTFSAGRISGSGPNLSTVARHLQSATKQASLRVPLSGGGRGKGRPLTVRVRVGFFPKKKGAPTSVAYTNVTFR
jgi:hypothetical protein